MKIKYPIAFSSWGAQEYQALQSVISSDQFTMATNISSFEQAFSEKVGSKYAIAVTSGSMANLIAVSSLFYLKENKLRKSDEVITSPIAWSTTYSPLIQNDLKIKLIDVKKETFNLDENLLKSATLKNTKLIIATNVLGNPCELEKIRTICDENKIFLIEDNCESIGAKVKNKYCGTYGDIGTFSFFYSHQINTMEGGMIVTDSEEIVTICKMMRAYGWSRDTNNSVKKYNYQFKIPGYNARPLEFIGAVGKSQLKKLDSLIDIRRKNATYFKEKFKNQLNFSLQKETDLSSWFCFPLLINSENKTTRSDVFEKLSKNQIEFRPITGGNITQHDVAEYINFESSSELKNATLIHENGFFVGNGGLDLTEQIDHLYNILMEI